MQEMDTPLAALLRGAIRELDFAATADHLQGGRAVGVHPSIDLAVVAFPAGRAPQWANVLFSREHPAGVVAEIDARAGAPRNIRFEGDITDVNGDSIAWQPGADWRALRFPPLAGQGASRFVAPYPASLLKLMVAVGVGLAVDRGLAPWPAALEPMITVSDNDATDRCVALLHQAGVIADLNRRFAALGLATLQLNDTTPAGGWRNRDGSGVGHIHMTAWDTARLLWLLDADAPPAPWLPPGTPALLSAASRAHLHGVLARQQLDHVLSSGSLRAVPGWVGGLPDAPAFAHKTGNTQNYSSDAGIVKSGRTHYLVALLSNLGSRYAPDERCATTWRLPMLGAALHRLMETLA